MRALLSLAALASLAIATPAEASILAELMPRVQLSTLSEFEHASPNGGGGASRAGDEAAVKDENARDDDDDRGETEPGLRPSRSHGALEPPKPRWKSMMPGALK